jgi:hypothetical protein
MKVTRTKRALLGAAVLVMSAILAPAATASAHRAPTVRVLTTFVASTCAGDCGSGSTVGPDGALYVTNPQAGTVERIDPRTGATSTFAQGLPQQISAVGLGGAMDVAFLGRTAYVLVSVVGPFFGQTGVVDGIYRVGRDGGLSVVADIGTWSTLHPPATDYFVASGVQYAMQAYRHGFLVTDGHHNRVLYVTLSGHIGELATFGDIVPTGLEVSGDHIYMGEAGPVPHVPATGKIVTFRSHSSTATDVASGASLIVDVEFARDHQLFGLSQGIWDLPNDPANAGAPASPDSGSLVKVHRDGTFSTVIGSLDRPTSLEFIGNTAFVVTLTGKVLRIDNAVQSGDD